MDGAVTQIINAAFGSAGERCMACAVVVSVGKTSETLIDKLVAAADKLIIGNGIDKNVFLGRLSAVRTRNVRWAILRQVQKRVRYCSVMDVRMRHQMAKGISSAQQFLIM